MRLVDTFFPVGVMDLHAQVRFALVAQRNAYPYHTLGWLKWHRAVQKFDGLAKYARTIATAEPVTLFNDGDKHD